MAYIKFENPATATFHDKECMPEGYTVTVSENGTAQVTKDVAENLVEKYDTITYNDTNE